ncbi:sugar transferase (PEP-CTERM system associated) [Rhizomicrobium palustre]|uniref:Sugar transferase (PEP-CTERM system associated) n=1 Tax=Rhizomicrobium palustre TaxID=189966 RepID=A0A846MU25_9PROT|nr:TIGR03013 family XrtA/PEP-CTERM system glycosyltransferase [Rhizomicrobium palustre]NIK86711.1 sugar transferase (PEP-CTERM system associated) [Rhizomicrobium palustre]
MQNTLELSQTQAATLARLPWVASTTPNYRLRRRFLPSSRTTLAGLDLVFMAGFMAALIYAVHARLGFATPVQTIAVILTMASLSMAFAYAAGCYRPDALVNFSTSITRLVVALAVSAALSMLIIHFALAQLFDALAFQSASRSLTIVLLGTGASLIAGMTTRPLFLAMARRHWFRRHILIIGTGIRAQHLRDLFRRSDRRLAELHFVTEDYLGGTPPMVGGEPVRPLPEVQSVAELEDQLHIDQVVVAVDDLNGLHFDHLLPWKANGVPVFDFNTFLERETGRVDLTWTASHWLVYSEGFRFGFLDRGLKRVLDITVSLGLLLLTLPTLVVIAFAILFEDFGPIFYRQERVSQNGKTFKIIKFRTMRVDAEKFGAQWASQNDPRVTRIGRFLRRSRIDEVPQLINVLLGEMSMVGPRPERPVFVDQLNAQIRLYHLRHSIKAGVTGWAQINYPYGASVEDAEKKLEYDLYYLKNFSVLRDLSIMLQTFRVLVFAQGSR